MHAGPRSSNTLPWGRGKNRGDPQLAAQALGSTHWRQGNKSYRPWVASEGKPSPPVSVCPSARPKRRPLKAPTAPVQGDPAWQ